jgi:hypothetical protein
MDSKLFFWVFLILTGCNPQQRIAGNYSFKTECLYAEHSGIIVVKGWGKGSNRLDALDNAQKNALEEVMLTGIQNGKQECGSRPLILKVNAKEVYADFLIDFFGKKGEYKKFIKRSRGGFKTIPDRKGGRGFVVYGVILEIDKEKLNQMLKKKNII